MRLTLNFTRTPEPAQTTMTVMANLRPRLILVNVRTFLVNNQLDAQFFFSYIFIPILYMFLAPLRSSSGELYQYDIWYMSLYVGDRLVCRFGWNSIQTCTLDSHLHTVTYTRYRIDTILLMMSTGVLETCRELE
jgi:hypothetical protein